MKKKLCYAREYGLIYVIGGTLYCILEVLWRGYTHPSMAIAGGLSLACIYNENLRHPARRPLAKCAVSAGIITCIEFCTGCIVNRMLHMNVWDYSNRKLNLMGQICPYFSALWFLLSIPALLICSSVQRKFHEQD